MRKNIIRFTLGTLLSALGFFSTMLFALSFPVEAQQKVVMSRIGVLGGAPGPQWEAFRQRLRDLGYIEGQNITIEFRWAKGRNELLPDLAAELVRIGVKVIVTEGTPAAQAAKNATSTIPIVMAIVGDAVGAGLVANLARPGGNITGLTSISPELTTKQVEILKDTVPGLRRVAVQWNPDNPLVGRLVLEQIERAAQALRLQLQLIEARGAGEFDKAFSTMASDRAKALLVVPDPTFDAEQRRIAELAAKSRLPTIYNKSLFAEAGGLLVYGPHYLDFFRRAGTFVDKILKGTKPGELPVEQPTKFEFIINLKTAKQIGLTIPPNMLASADRVIK